MEAVRAHCAFRVCQLRMKRVMKKEERGSLRLYSSQRETAFKNFLVWKAEPVTAPSNTQETYCVPHCGLAVGVHNSLWSHYKSSKNTVLINLTLIQIAKTCDIIIKSFYLTVSPNCHREPSCSFIEIYTEVKKAVASTVSTPIKLMTPPTTIMCNLIREDRRSAELICVRVLATCLGICRVCYDNRRRTRNEPLLPPSFPCPAYIHCFQGRTSAPWFSHTCRRSRLNATTEPPPTPVHKFVPKSRLLRAYSYREWT